MAFVEANFEHIAGHRPGFRIFGYQSADDNVAAITAANYFLPAIGRLAVNDAIIVVGSDSRGMAIVNSNTGTAIDTTDIVAINTDTG